MKNGIIRSRYVYEDDLRIAAEYPDGKLVAEFVYATSLNVPDYMIKSGEKYRFIKDRLGSPRMIVKANDGTIVQEIEYNEWGRILRDTNPGFQPFGFAGGLYDQDTKLVRFGAREYDPEVGRWMSKDPILFAGGDTNLYGYVLNDPVNLIDSDGLSARDVERIRNRFNQTVSKLTNLGLRHPFGPWNNMNRTIGDLTGNRIGNSNFLGCYEQANEAKRALENQSCDDNWTFTPKDRVIHHWIEGRSSNPNDPVLRIDPWWGTIGVGK